MNQRVDEVTAALYGILSYNLSIEKTLYSFKKLIVSSECKREEVLMLEEYFVIIESQIRLLSEK